MKNKLLKTIIMLSKCFVYGLVIQTLLLNLVLAVDVSGQYKKVEEVTIVLSSGELTLDQFFKEVQRQTPFKFSYENQDLDQQIKFCFSKKKGSVIDFLGEASVQSDLAFRQVNHGIDVKKRSNSITKGDSVVPEGWFPVSGKVTDATGQSIPGVTVIVKGTTSGTVTDLDGNYTISANKGDVLVFSFVGFVTQEVVIDSQTTIDIQLNDDTQSLQEVVVVGYGEQQKVNLTGAISTVKFDDELNNRPITNASQALGGTASGVWVSQNSGKPGADGAQIRVRGWGTLNNSNPLVIIDGVEGSFEQLNPADIENISVLKDAASSAIFGSKAANGVILVTTKMGKTNEKMEVSLNSYVGIQSLGRRYDLVDNSATHMEITNTGLGNDGGSPLFSEDLIASFRNGNDPYKYPNTDWFKELFQTAPMQEHNLSFRGGSQSLSSFLSFNYLDQEGMVPNTSSRRYSIRANLESNVNKWLKISGRFSYLSRNSEEPYSDVTYGSLGRVFEMLGGATPYIAPYTKDGRFGSVQAIAADGTLLYDNRNPLIDAANGLTETQDNVFTFNASADVKFSDAWSFRTTVASNINMNLVDRYNTSVFGYTDTGVETITKNYNREGIEINRGNVIVTNNNLFSTFNFKKNYNEVHAVSAIAGLQLESNKIQNVYARRSLPPKEGLTQVDAGTSGIQGQGNQNELHIFSYFGRVNYTLKDKYLFEANFRADGSSRFKDGNRWGYFPGFSAGWRLSDEQFIQDLGLFSNLKIRASWGKLGNQSIANFWPYLTVINQNNSLSYSYGGAFAPGAAVTALVDENITWETTATLDFGIEFGFLDDKITLETDYFKKKTEDIIVQLPIPLLMGGLTPPFQNLGEMSNNGFEFIFNYNNLKLGRDQLGFNIGLNATYIKNQVTEFGTSRSPDQLYLIREGYSYRTLYGYNAVGIYQSDAEALEHMFANGFKPKAGNLKFEDVNQDGKLGFEDKKALGNTIPKITFGFSPSFKYKGFDLNILFQGILGVSVYTQNNFTNLSFENRAISKRWLDAWSPENTDTSIPRLRFDNSWDNSQSSFWVQELNYIKLKNIQLGYALPEQTLSKFGLQKAYFYLNAQNVFTLVTDDYQGYDPERNTFDSGLNVYPVPRIVSFGVNLNF